VEKRIWAGIVLGMVMSLTGWAAQARGPSDEEMAKMKAAMPAKPQVTPKKSRKLLVFSRSYGYFHTAIPYGKAAFAMMGEKTGAFEAVVSDDIAMFEPEKLSEFDAVLFNNANQEVFMPDEPNQLPAEDYKKAKEREIRLRKSLIEFVKSGKGIAAIHASTNCFRDWDEFAEMMGARFDNHPWEAGSPVTLRVEEPNHPLMAAFKEPYFIIEEETYQHKAPYSRQNVRVLMSVDPARTSVKLDHVSWIHRTDNDFPIVWVKSYGSGRVFYSAIGHQHEHIWNPVILQHFLDGIQFVLGDITAETTPGPKLSTAK